MRRLRISLRIIFPALVAAFAYGQVSPDITQAEAMLNLLRACHANTAMEAEIDRILSLPGTELVIAQQNISRRVTGQQYREVLLAACSGKIAQVKPAEQGTRAEKGVTGLIEDVAPSLVWGREHVPLLESRLSELRRNPSLGGVVPLARKYLPEQVPLKPKLFVVMGGRAGAAAIEDQLYFDILSMAWRVSRGELQPMSPTEVVEFFAHEAHHLGYSQILDRMRDSLNLTGGEAQAWNFLSAIMMEGSATLLINGHENLADLEKQSSIRPYLDQAPQLLPAMENLLRRTLIGPIPEEDYEPATAPFLNMGYHAAGAILLAAIEKKRGLAGVMEVMADPRRLLTAYNDCANESSVAFKFNAALAERVAHAGEPRPK